MDPRWNLAVATSTRWYRDMFALHGVPARQARGVWQSTGTPPPLHSAVKTLVPDVRLHDVLQAAGRLPGLSVADSFGNLTLDRGGFDRLFSATWVHHPPVPSGPLPDGWSRVADRAGLAAWVAAHGTEGIFVPAVLDRPEFALMARHEAGTLTAGLVAHDAGPSVGVSHAFTTGGAAFDWAEALRVVGALHPGRPVFDYHHGRDLDDALDAGFAPVGDQVVWVRPEA